MVTISKKYFIYSVAIILYEKRSYKTTKQVGTYILCNIKLKFQFFYNRYSRFLKIILHGWLNSIFCSMHLNSSVASYDTKKKNMQICCIIYYVIRSGKTWTVKVLVKQVYFLKLWVHQLLLLSYTRDIRDILSYIIPRSPKTLTSYTSVYISKSSRITHLNAISVYNWCCCCCCCFF